MRVIARLDTKGRRLIKGIQFEGVRVIGDALDFATHYYQNGIDEIIYIDAVASLYGRPSMSGLLEDTVEKVFVPVTAGGGITTVDDVSTLLAKGADKVAINTGIVKNPDLIRQVSDRFGSQCMVVSIQAKLIGPNQWEVYTDCGREKSGIDVLDWARTCEQLGAGEILITSVDKDGTLSGPDYDLVGMVTKAVGVPVVASGGIAEQTHIEHLVQQVNADAIAIGRALHIQTLKIDNIKDTIGDQ